MSGILMNLTEKWIRKPVKKSLVTGIILFAVLGCGSGTNVLYPLHARPYIPPIVGDPHDVWVMCSSYGAPSDAIVHDMYCVKEDHVIELRKFIILQNALIEKYEKNIELHNSTVD